jgi:hypothetical protein
MRKLIILLILLFAVNYSYSQEFKYSGYVYGGTGLAKSGVPVNLYGKRTDPYDVSFPSYPSTPPSYTTGTAIASSDDATHGPFSIGFTFTFFGTNYTQFYVGSNGWIGFSAAQTTGYTAAYIPNTSSPKNVIMADWEDLLPGLSNIRYTTTGSAPNRKLIVSFYQVPHYSCNTNLHTFQFILNEMTNVIEINYAAKPLCGSNNATAGLVNSDNSNVVPVGGKNASTWSVSNYSVKFTPTSAETTFSLKNTYTTDATGKYTINSGLDVQSYSFQIVIDSPGPTTLSQSDLDLLNDIVLKKVSINSAAYYKFDLNSDGKITVSDIFCGYAKLIGLFANWISPTPNYRIFTPSEWTTISAGSTDLRPTIAGQSSITVTSPANNGSSNFNIITTGKNN